MVESNLEKYTKIDPNEIEDLEEADIEGGQGEIFVGYYKDKNVIIKKFKETKDANFKEINIYTKLRHDLMVQFYGYFYDEENKLNIVIEYAEGEQLDDLLVEGKLTEQHNIKIIENIAGLLKYFRENHALHRDLKPQNFIANIISDDDIDIKVLDFGISKIANQTVFSQTSCSGSIQYVPPEFMEVGGKISFKFDIWSYGLIVSYLYSEEKPWGNKTSPMTIEFNLFNKRKFPIPTNIKDPGIAKLIELCTNIDQDKRINPEGVLFIIEKIKKKEDISNLTIPDEYYK